MRKGQKLGHRPANFIDLTGKIYGQLEVLKWDGNKEYAQSRIGKWVCKCSCGNQTTRFGLALRKGTARSCGCTNPNKALPFGEASFNRVYGKVRDGALKRNLVWELDKENVRKLVTSNCYYCDCSPDKEIQNKYGNFKWNGVDRKNPDIGYTLENSVSCCWICNFMKHNQSSVDFISRCQKIAENKNR